jgi:Flp pilus assembly protein TadG
MKRTPREFRKFRLFKALTSDRSGGSAVEFAFAAPAFLMFIFGIMELGRVLWLQNALDYSVVAAARCISNNQSQCGNASQTQSFAASQAGAGFAASVFTVTSASCGNKISASYPVVLDIPYMNISTTLTSQACYPV